MSKENMFELAVRSKMRFPFRGLISVEDLWDLSLENLDMVFKALNSKFKQAKEESLLERKSKEDELVEVQIEIVRYIVKIKQDEKQAKQEEKAKSVERQRILEVLAVKKDEGLMNKSEEELNAMLAALDR